MTQKMILLPYRCKLKIPPGLPHTNLPDCNVRGQEAFKPQHLSPRMSSLAKFNWRSVWPSPHSIHCGIRFKRLHVRRNSLHGCSIRTFISFSLSLSLRLSLSLLLIDWVHPQRGLIFLSTPVCEPNLTYRATVFSNFSVYDPEMERWHGVQSFCQFILYAGLLNQLIRFPLWLMTSTLLHSRVKVVCASWIRQLVGKTLSIISEALKMHRPSNIIRYSASVCLHYWLLAVPWLTW